MVASARSERERVADLGEHLKASDELLVGDVRLITAQHEERRRALLSELQRLASRLGYLPIATPPATAMGPATVARVEQAGRRDLAADCRLPAAGLPEEPVMTEADFMAELARHGLPWPEHGPPPHRNGRPQ